MTLPRSALCSLSIVAALLVTSCAQTPAPIEETPSPPPLPPLSPASEPAPKPAEVLATAPARLEEPSALSAFELRRREQALSLQKEGRWAEAAAEWEILALLRPDRAEYRSGLGEMRARIGSAVSERLSAASEARQRGDTERAQLLYLKALSLDPHNATAARALREVEAERSRRSRLGRPAGVVVLERLTQSRAEAEASGAPPDRRDLDQGIALLRRGEYGASIRVLESQLKIRPADEVARRHLADAYFQLGQQRLQQGRNEEALHHLERALGMKGDDGHELIGTLSALRKSLAEEYYQRGLRAHGANIGQAITLWERAVRYDPSHFNASARLQQARQMEKNLRAIDGSGKRR